MADIRWVGGATATAQVDTITIASVGVGETMILTVTGENGDTVILTTTAVGSDVDVEATAVALAWNTSTSYLVSPVTAAAQGSGGTLTLTADTAGIPFTVALSGTIAGDWTNAATTASSGPYDWDIADNWLDGAKPGNTDDVYIEDATVLYGMDQSSVSPDSLLINNSQVGFNPQSGTKAPYLQIAPVVLDINVSSGPGTRANNGPIMVDVATKDTIIVVGTSGTNATSTLPSVWLKMLNDAGTLTVNGGVVGYGYDNNASDSTLCNKLTINGGTFIGGYLAGVDGTTAQIHQTGGTSTFWWTIEPTATSPTVTIDGGTTTFKQYTDSLIPALYVNGGTVNVVIPLTLLVISSGTVNVTPNELDGNAIGQADIYGGALNLNGVNTVTTLNMYGGTTDTTGSNKAIIITTAKINPSAVFKYQPSSITLTNPIEPISTTDARYFTWTVT